MLQRNIGLHSSPARSSRGRAGRPAGPWGRAGLRLARRCTGRAACRAVAAAAAWTAFAPAGCRWPPWLLAGLAAWAWAGLGLLLPGRAAIAATPVISSFQFAPARLGQSLFPGQHFARASPGFRPGRFWPIVCYYFGRCRLCAWPIFVWPFTGAITHS